MNRLFATIFVSVTMLFCVAVSFSTAEAASAWRDPVTGIDFVWVPGGCYQMGNNDGECDKHAVEDGCDERPVHKVCVGGFWMGRYEVTQAEWQRLMENNPSRFKGDRNPVEQASWSEIQESIRKLNASGNDRFRLPSEAEWEYAARSGGRDEKFAGGNDPDLVAWHDGNSAQKKNAGGNDRHLVASYVGGLKSGHSPHPVGTKAPNGLGLYDMSGNVWEWCEDVYDANAYANHARNNPIHNAGGPHRVVRGGSWNDNSDFVRATIRSRVEPGFRDQRSFLGFRLVRTE